MTSNTELVLSSLNELAAAKRMRLSADWPTANQVGLAMGISPVDASKVVTQLRKQGALLGAYMVEPTHHWRFPTWQFDVKHQPIAGMAEILAILREHGPYLDEMGRTTGWGEVQWFRCGHALLKDRPPCDLLREDPHAVLYAAHVEYIEESRCHRS